MQNRVQTTYLVDPNHHFGINWGILSLIVVISLVFSASLAAQIDDAHSAAPIRVLFIGNSHTTWLWSLPQTVSKLAASPESSVMIEVGQSVQGNTTLADHWNIGAAVRVIQQGGWDFVVLQDASGQPVNNPQALKEYVRRFDEEIKQSGANTVLFMTWAWESTPDMIEPVAEVFNDTSAQLGAIVAPVGRAWQRAIGLKPELSLYYTDGNHSNGVGIYLTSCVFYTVLTGKSPVGLSGREAQPFSGSLVRVSDEHAHFLQQIAFETVAEFAPETIQVAVSPKGRLTTMWGEIKTSKSANGF